MTQQPMNHEEAIELSGLYVLDALTDDERADVDAHLASCSLPHAEFDEVGGAAAALAMSAAPVGAPAALKRRVLEEYRAEMKPVSASPPRSSAIPSWAGWFAAAAALLVVAVVGVYALGVSNDRDIANARAVELRQAIAALSAPGAETATLTGSGAAEGARGFAAFPPAGNGYVVVTGLPSVPAGRTYQAWYIANGTPASAGVMSVDADGVAVLSNATPVAGTSVVALTVEPAGGSQQPTSDPIVVGTVKAPG